MSNSGLELWTRRHLLKQSRIGWWWLTLLGLAVLGGCPSAPANTDLEQELAGLRAELVALQEEVAALRAEVTLPTEPDVPAPTVELAGDARVLEVPSQYPTIQAALDALDAVWFVGEGTATIQVEDGTYVLEAPLTFDHPQGRRVSVVGNLLAPEQVVLECAACLALENTSLGRLNGFTMQYVKGAGATGPGGSDGVFITGPSLVTLGPSLTIRGFLDDGVEATHGAVVDVTGITVENAGDDGIVAAWGAHIDASETTSSGSNDAIRAHSHASIRAQNAIVSATDSGVEVHYNSFVDTSNTQVDGAYRGLWAFRGGVLRAFDMHVQNSGSRGLECADSSSCVVENTVFTNNATDIYAILGGFVELGNTTYTTVVPPVSTDGSKNSWVSP